MKKFIFAVFYFIALIQIFAQKDTIYFNKDFNLCDKENSAYTRSYSLEPNGLFKFIDFKNGKLLQIGYSKIQESSWYYIKEGKFTQFYENGRRCTDVFYKNNILTGIGRDYFLNGSLKFTYVYKEKDKIDPFKPSEYLLSEAFDSTGKQMVHGGIGKLIDFSEEKKGNTTQVIKEIGNYINGEKDSIWVGYKNEALWYQENYTEGKLSTGVSYDSLGKAYNYSMVEKPSEFIGGIESLMKFLSENVKYPEKARRKNISGRVLVKFIIKKDGSLGKIEVLKNVNSLLDEEAIRVVKLTQGHWTISSYRGIPYDNYFTLPVNFKLE